ncbi:MAG: GGDEF domain-containing protein [Treponema sp.]|nr:GGDEF domain-containing protein [Treponema sp.]
MKKKLNPKKIKFTFSFSVGIVIILIVTVLTNTVMSRSLKNARDSYYESCHKVVEGYSQSIYWYLENYHTSLSSIYNENLFKKENAEDIQKWLIDNLPFIDEDFCILYYVTPDGKGYFSNGATVDLSDRSYLKTYTTEKGSLYVTDFITTPYTDYPIFIIEEPVFSEDNVYYGMLCAAVKIQLLEKVTKEIKIGDKCNIYLQDRNGIFLIHPDSSYIGKTFVPSNPQFAHISSVIVSNSTEGLLETENENGEIVDLFYTKVSNCGWTLGLAFPKKYLLQLYKQQNKTRFIILFISLISLIILILLENIILDIFYKKQIINTDYDPLTNLWTRQRFEAEASRIMKRYTRAKFMLIESDIRGFKFINQNYGEEAADKIIFFYSTLLNSLTNEYHGIIGRGYADHFYSFIKITEVRKAMAAFRKGMEEVNEKLKTYEIPFFPKFGIAFLMPNSAERETTIQSLIGRASFAKSTIKDNMITQYSIYNSKLLAQINKEHYLESVMEASLETKEFFVMYQPKIALSSDRIVGAEALVRWYNKDLGLLTPDKFIPLFERNGFITKLDFYVYDQVFQFLSRQIKEHKPVVPISLNMSRNHSKPDKFMHDFMALFKRYSIPPHLIQVEILERSVMDSNTLQEITNMLHKEGFTVAMDDFGSGESSLNMLTKVPVDVLKFDREFLLSSTKENGSMDAKSAKFIEILIDLSKHLDKETVFEGVETQAQRDFLRSIECDQAQGYFYSKPLSEQDYIQFINMHS